MPWQRIFEESLIRLLEQGEKKIMATLAVGLLSAAPGLLMSIGHLVHGVEHLFGHGQPDVGIKKKDLVIGMIEDMLDSWNTLSGVTKQPQLPKDALRGHAAQIIDALVGLYNDMGIFT